ncbi:MAG: hypothetical protein ACRDWS_06050 [Acidimicrobiia bacterium]
MPRRPIILAVCLLVAATACTTEHSSTSTVVAGTVATTAPPLPTDVAELPGRLVVLDDGGNIVIVDPDGSNPAPVTDDSGDSARYRQPSFSPVTDMLVWSEITTAGTGLGSSGGPGGGRVTIPMTAPPFYMSWSPDGTGIGVLHNGPQGSIEFELVDVEAASAQVVASGAPFYFSWSPDSSQVAVHVQFEVFATIDVDGNSTDLGATADGYQAPHWTPAGIFHLGDNGLEVVQLAGQTRLLATASGPVAFVANRQGSRVAVQSFVANETPGINAALSETPALPPNRVVVVDVATGELSEVIPSSSIGLFWSPDGESLLVLQPVGEGSGEINALVWKDDDTTEASTIAPHPSFVGEVLQFFDQYGQSLQLWAPDSSAFALVGAIDGDPGVWVHPIGGGDAVKVHDGTWVSWSNT